ncbi:MAG: barstar family protein [Clostridia bacterium]|nr:barstar family protein [Clostridia bacterium]
MAGTTLKFFNIQNSFNYLKGYIVMLEIYTIDGAKVYDLDTFLAEFAKAVNAPNNYFGNDLLGFDDCLFGGFGLEAPCKIIWKNSNLSKQRLNSEMLRAYYEREKNLYEEGLVGELKEFIEHGRTDATEQDCFSYSRVEYSTYMIEKATNGELDLFDEIVNTIQTVSERASNKTWTIELILEE